MNTDSEETLRLLDLKDSIIKHLQEMEEDAATDVDDYSIGEKSAYHYAISIVEEEFAKLKT